MDIRSEKGTVTEVATDLLVIPVFEGGKSLGPAVKAVDRSLDGYVADVLKDESFEGKPGKTLLLHTQNAVPAKRLLFVGLGKKAELSTESVRRSAGAAASVAQKTRSGSLAFVLQDIVGKSMPAKETAQACIEGVRLGSYRFSKYKGKEEQREVESTLEDVVLVATDAAQARSFSAGVALGNFMADAAIYARDLVNEPAAVITPRRLVQEAEKIAKNPGVTAEAFGKGDLKRMRMGAFLAVSEGSEEEPYLIHLKYKPVKKAAKKVVLCGKGVTFDTGGLSLKPAQYMVGMKQDMAGAAAVLGAFTALASLKPAVEVHGVIPATENMPSGHATKPGDIVKAYNGKTIEILNTDAEGRLILADALSWAENELKPDMMVDVATLTGAAIIALGQEVAAIVGSDDKLISQFENAAKTTGEQVWQLPLVKEYAQLIKSDVADLQNIATTRWADTIMGGLFLHAFVEQTPWMHLDIAGPAFAEKQILSYTPVGGTGFGVRTLLQFLTSLR